MRHPPFLILLASLFMACDAKKNDTLDASKQKSEYDGLINCADGTTLSGQVGVEWGCSNGEKHGKWLAMDNGKRLSEKNYSDGEPHGTWTYWYDNGQKRSEENFQKGERDGTWSYWHENGKLKEVHVYQSGKLRKHQGWDEDGNQRFLDCWDAQRTEVECASSAN